MLYLFIVLLLHQSAFAQNPEELGRIHWYRDLEQARKSSKEQGKPLLILFQEVPGCSTCKSYGNQILSHPLIVEAVEQYFVPLCIYNNKQGKDRQALDLFKEPSWNNPVVRIVDHSFKDIVSRLSGDYSTFAFVSKLNASLIQSGLQVPNYLQLVEEEEKAAFKGSQKITVSTSCFWSGEKVYGQIPGVLNTKALYTSAGEAVEITYDPTSTTQDQILTEGKKRNVANFVVLQNESNKSYSIPSKKVNTIRADPETKYYLYTSEYRIVPMTPLQALKVNAYLGEGLPCEKFLSPRQLDYFKNRSTLKLSCKQNQIGKDFMTAWYQCSGF